MKKWMWIMIMTSLVFVAGAGNAFAAEKCLNLARLLAEAQASKNVAIDLTDIKPVKREQFDQLPLREKISTVAAAQDTFWIQMDLSSKSKFYQDGCNTFTIESSETYSPLLGTALHKKSEGKPIPYTVKMVFQIVQGNEEELTLKVAEYTAMSATTEKFEIVRTVAKPTDTWNANTTVYRLLGHKQLEQTITQEHSNRYSARKCVEIPDFDVRQSYSIRWDEMVISPAQVSPELAKLALSMIADVKQIQSALDNGETTSDCRGINLMPNKPTSGGGRPGSGTGHENDVPNSNQPT